MGAFYLNKLIKLYLNNTIKLYDITFKFWHMANTGDRNHNHKLRDIISSRVKLQAAGKCHSDN